MTKSKIFRLVILTFVITGGGFVFGASRASTQASKIPRATTVRTYAPRGDETELRTALALANQKKYDLASRMLFNLARSPKYINQRARIKYILGLMLYEMKFYQMSAFQFVDVIRDGKSTFVRQSLQKLSVVADALSDDTLLNYAIGKVSINEFPAESRDMLRYRVGEFMMKRDRYPDAVANLSKVPSNSPYFPKAKYLQALVEVKAGRLPEAMRSFAALADNRSASGVTDIDRVAALMGMARVAYQMHKWDLSIDLYRQIPRDTELWHDALFESSWAHLRAAHFRSVLSNLHSLHSPYYDDFYLPESILLRGIVYLYICQYDEMEKTLGLFEKIYKPVLDSLTAMTTRDQDVMAYFNDIEKIIKNFDTLKQDVKARQSYRVPFIVARSIMKEGDFKHTYSYINQLRAELSAVNQMPSTWRHAPIGVYSTQVLRTRLASGQKTAGLIVKNHMITMRNDLADLFEQYNFGKYEMINGKKELLKKKIQGKGLRTAHVDDANNRDYYIQNGFEYWPFGGEYWLDEIGDYHYVGTQGCEQ